MGTDSWRESSLTRFNPVFDAYWRPDVTRLGWMRNLNVPIVGLSATLPPGMGAEAMHAISGPHRPYREIRAPHATTKMRRLVNTGDEGGIRKTLKSVMKQATTQNVMLVFTLDITEAENLSSNRTIQAIFRLVSNVSSTCRTSERNCHITSLNIY